MRKGGSKQKGASFEREVCVLLSRWVSEGKQDDVFWRSAMSGGRSTVASRKGKRLAAQAGDISCIHPIGAWLTERFHIECKFYQDLGYNGLVTGKGPLIKFWHETIDEADKYQKNPMLIAKQNHVPAIICINLDGASVLQLNSELLLIAPPHNLRMMHLDQFLKLAVRIE